MNLLVISDHIALNSGVANQIKSLMNGLLSVNKDINIISAGVIKSKDVNYSTIQKINDRFSIIPIESYDSVDNIYNIINYFNIDKVLIITDPRFYFNFFTKLSASIPIIYWHVWDNYPVPVFNDNIYFSCEAIGCISKLTYNCVTSVVESRQKNFPNKPYVFYAPHFCLKNNFFLMDDRTQLLNLRKENNIKEEDFVILFNSVNMWRKNLQQVIYTFSEFNKMYKNSKLIIKTINTQSGFDIGYLTKYFGCFDDVKVIDTATLDVMFLNMLYNLSDVTINISTAEGFGLSALESLCAGTPVIVTRTGGLQDSFNVGSNEQFDKVNNVEFTERGCIITPSFTRLTSSYAACFIFEDFVANSDVIMAFEFLYKNRDKFDLQKKKKISDDTFLAFNGDTVIEKFNDAIVKAEVDSRKFYNNILSKDIIYNVENIHITNF